MYNISVTEKMIARTGKYFKPEVAEQYPECHKGRTWMKVYDTGLYKICPNPDHPIVNEYENRYQQGKILDVRTYYVPYDDFINPYNWNE